MTVLLIIILVLLALVLFILAPSRRRRRMEAWKGVSFAHRGLHGEGAAENTMTAFERACEEGFGIELDVQLTKDGALVVFHDDDLKRMTGDPRRVDEVELAELQSLALPYGERIPLFEGVLARIDGRVPLLVELKNGKRNAELCEKTLALLKRYRGRYVIESFNPLIVRWFRMHAKGVLRGQLVSAMENYMPQFGKGIAWMLASLALNCIARPDFVAYDVDAKFVSPRIQRALFNTPMACWTVKKRERYEEALKMREMPIFEGFVPEKTA